MLKLLPAAFLSLLVAVALPAQAQRNFTEKALRGELVVGQPPDALLNGKPARLAPGARIRDQSNILQLSASLSVKNLLDKRYYTIFNWYNTYTWGAPRSVSVSMTYKF